MATTSSDDEALIDAQLQETERSLEELKKKRAELLRAKEAIRWAKTKASVSREAAAAAKPAMAEVASVANPPSFSPTKALEKVLNSMEWSSYKKREGEWAFLRKRDGSVVDALTSEPDFVNQLRKGKQIVVGKYRYAVSEDKFLSRHFEV